MEKIEVQNKLFAITDYIIKRHKVTDSVKIQKILYFLYLEYLKEKNQKLFEDEFEAWIYGPVLRTVYNHLKYNGLFFDEYETLDIDKGPIFIKFLSLDDKEIMAFIDKKITKYKNQNTFNLVEKTHQTSPWIKARKGLKEDEPSTRKIKFSDLEKFVKTWQS
ncbi:hypothetical protein LT335_00606 [Spiroplasma sp. JKS002669]|uniref:Panacea domain-containing protein n=1 Tax=Spiroplasma attinicola TaxID=2904537 RepID=UPI0020C0FA44|nr:type II toxin-antitoxin system antitoxin SocA domain-containing protein [Spiroplasma sp. JKS002669]MCL6429045.1 hypothetical protein [Spiroplasma sp. JKS002669]